MKEVKNRMEIAMRTRMKSFYKSLNKTPSKEGGGYGIHEIATKNAWSS